MRKISGKFICAGLLLGLSIFAFSGFTFAEVIILSSGEKIEANVITKDNNSVTIDYKGTTIRYYTFEIKSIDGEALPHPVKDSTKPSTGKVDTSLQIEKVNLVTAEEYMQRGTAFYNKNNFDLAVADFTRAIKIEPKSARAYLQRGLAYSGKGEQDNAFADFAKAVEVDPNFEEGYYVRGQVYANKNKLDAAVSDYTKAVQINPKYVQAYLNRGFINVNRGKLEEGIADFNKIININPAIPVAYYVRGIAYANKGNLEQAIKDYTKAIELNPQYTEAYLNRGLAYVYKGTFDQAKVDPNSPKAYINIGPTYSNKADLKHAVADCQKAIEISPKATEPYFVRARVHFLSRDYDKAWQDVKKAEELGGKTEPQFLDDLKKSSGRDK